LSFPPASPWQRLRKQAALCRRYARLIGEEGLNPTPLQPRGTETRLKREKKNFKEYRRSIKPGEKVVYMPVCICAFVYLKPDDVEEASLIGCSLRPASSRSPVTLHRRLGAGGVAPTHTQLTRLHLLQCVCGNVLHNDCWPL